MNDTSKKPRVLYLSEGTSCPEQEWSDEPRSYGGEPYTPFVPYSDYQKLESEINYLNRMLADERSGDCDKDKTIRRLESNYQSLKEQCEKMEKALEFYSPKEKWNEFISTGGCFYEQGGDFVECFDAQNGDSDQGSTARQALEEYRKSKGEL